MPKIPTKPQPKKTPLKIHQPQENNHSSAVSKPSPKTKGSNSVKSSKQGKTSRPVLYPNVEVMICQGNDALTSEKAKELLGWMEESENVKFEKDYVPEIHSLGGLKVQLANNSINRFIRPRTIKVLMQQILRKRWWLNGETIIIGKTGSILNGQHSLIALILSALKWEEKSGQYKEWWETEPVMDKLVVVGIEETDDVVNTIDTPQVRDLTDVIGRSTYFAKYGRSVRKQLARMANYAIRTLWFRTGAGENAFATNRTHAESLDFLERHIRLLECIKHLFEEDGNEGLIRKYIGPGNASALMYLMATALTDREQENGYIKVSNPSEEQLDFELYDKAAEFWTLLAVGDKQLLAVTSVMAEMSEEGPLSVTERTALIVKAWNTWTSNKKVTPSNLELEYTKDDDGYPVLAETPVVGGIDIGKSV